MMAKIVLVVYLQFSFESHFVPKYKLLLFCACAKELFAPARDIEFYYGEFLRHPYANS